MQIDVYGREGCSWCKRAVLAVLRAGFALNYRDMTDNPDVVAELEAKAPGFKTVPQIFVGDHLIGGHDELARALNEGVIQQIIGGH